MNIRNRMPNHKWLGTKLKSADTYLETKVSFKDISTSPKMDKIHKPQEQGSLNSDTVDKMIQEYSNHPSYLNFKNKIVIGVLNETWYLVDGQHRTEMARQLYTDHNVDDHLIFSWYMCETEEDMRSIFESINIDSMKNRFFIAQSTFDQMLITEFGKELKGLYKDNFAKKKTENGKIKTIEEFRDELITINFFTDKQKYQPCFVNDKFSSKQAIFFLRSKNKKFYEIGFYERDITHHKDCFYKEEIKHIEQNIIVSLKNSNFIEWLSSSAPPFHVYKKNKQSISPYKKEQVWKREFKEEKTGQCPISFCENILTQGIKGGWEAGHVISERNGGATEPYNLRPICKRCNCSMGSKNWGDYDSLS